MIALVLGLALGGASVEPARVRLEWSAPSGCPRQPEVVARAERLLLVSDAELTARGVIERQGNAWQLVLVIEQEDGAIEHRQLAQSCAALGDLAALWIAVAADPVAVSTAAPIASPPVVAVPSVPPLVEPAPTSESPPPVASPPALERATSRPRSRRTLGGWVRVAGIVGAAELPTIDAGVGIAAALGVGRWRVELGLSHLFARGRELPGLAPARAELSAWNASLRGCGELGPRRVRLGACVGPELGAAVGHAVGVAKGNDRAAPWVALLAGPALRWRPIDRVQLHLAVDAVLALARPSFVLRDDPDAAVSTGRGGIRATLGVAVAFGPGEIDPRSRARR